MKQQLKKMAVAISALVIVLFLIFATNQILSLYGNLYLVHPLLAKILTGLLTVALLGLILTPVILYLKLPQAISPPNNPEEQAVYLNKLKKRLKSNPYLKSEKIDLEAEGGLKKALEILDKRANEVIQATAGSVFLTTAVSQNGKLDAFTVLVTQCKMVWSVAHTYWQRPSLRDMTHLYANVGGAAFLASEIEDIDLSRQIEPILNAVMKSPSRSLPFVGHAAHILTDSILEGSTNAFLTLRVGVIAKKYCSSLEVYDAKKVKKGAFIEASVMLKSLVVSTSGKVVKGLVRATKNTGVSTFKSGINTVGKVSNSVKDGFLSLTRRKSKSPKALPSPDKGEN